jgi:hypothetical protein
MLNAVFVPRAVFEEDDDSGTFEGLLRPFWEEQIAILGDKSGKIDDAGFLTVCERALALRTRDAIEVRLYGMRGNVVLIDNAYVQEHYRHRPVLQEMLKKKGTLEFRDFLHFFHDLFLCPDPVRKEFDQATRSGNTGVCV